MLRMLLLCNSAVRNPDWLEESVPLGDICSYAAVKDMWDMSEPASNSVAFTSFASPAVHLLLIHGNYCMYILTISNKSVIDFTCLQSAILLYTLYWVDLYNIQVPCLCKFLTFFSCWMTEETQLKVFRIFSHKSPTITSYTEVFNNSLANKWLNFKTFFFCSHQVF